MIFKLQTIANKVVKAFKDENYATQPEHGDIYAIDVNYKGLLIETELTVNIEGGIGYDYHDGVSWVQSGSTPTYNYDCNCLGFDKNGKPFEVPENVKEKIKDTLIYQLS